jgi:hypothetical protein
VEEGVHVSLVGRLAVEHPRPDARLGRLGLDHRESHVPETHAAVLLRHVGQPQALAHGLLAQPEERLDVVAALGLLHLVAVPEGLHRGPDDVVDEGADPGADLLVLRSESEIDHGCPPCAGGGAPAGLLRPLCRSVTDGNEPAGISRAHEP